MGKLNANEFTYSHAYLERVCNPLTPSDLLLALQNPFSKAHQDLMNLLSAEEEFVFVLERLIERAIQHQFRMEDAVKEELIEKFAQRAAQQTLPHYRPQFVEDTSTILGHKETQLLQAWHESQEKIIAIQAQITQLQQAFAANTKRQQALTAAWDHIYQQQIQTNVQHLKQQGLQLAINDRNGQTLLMQADDPRVIALLKKSQGPSSDQMLKILSQSYAFTDSKPRRVKVKKLKKVKAPSTTLLANATSVMDELRFVANAAQVVKDEVRGGVEEGVELGSKILAKIRENKRALQAMAKTAKEGVGEKVRMLNEQVDAMLDKTEISETLHKKERDLKECFAQSKRYASAYQAKTGHAPKSSIPVPPPAPGSKKT